MPQAQQGNQITSSAQLGTGVVDSAAIADTTIDTADIKNGAVTEAKQTLADNTTNDVATTKHGYAPKAPNDATKFLNGAAAYAQPKESDLVLTDIATNDVSITKHGLVPKAPNDTTKYLRGDATWAAVSAQPAWVDEGSLAWAAETADKSLTFTNAGKEIYMIIFNFTTINAAMDFRLNGDTGTNYNVVTITATGFGGSEATTSMTLSPNSTGGFGGTLYITGGNVTTKKHVSGHISSSTSADSTFYKGNYSAAATLSSITVRVNGGSTTGKMHAYSLNL